MFLVLADDFTGAAEIGGVAWRYGLTADVLLAGILDSRADVVVFDTDSRSLPDADAASCVLKLAPELHCLRVFKKVDSVLRGPVIAEVKALLEATGSQRALLVPCNPSLGRTIEGGEYRINGVPIHKTDFSRDPEHPIRSSIVAEMLGTPGLVVLPAGCELPPFGIFVGEAVSESDIAVWASRLDAGTVAVGAASFFAAILEQDGYLPKPLRKSLPAEKVLLISGSASEYSRCQIEEMRDQGVPVFTMPSSVEAVIDGLRSSTRVVIKARLSAELLTLIENLLHQVSIDQLWVEGGGTASAVMRRLGWNELNVHQELAPGVVALQPDAVERPLVVVKPGSYRWMLSTEDT